MSRTLPSQHVSAGGMSLLVHGLFVTFLLFGVSWRNLPHLPVEAELWNSLPEPPAPSAPAPSIAPPPEPTRPEVAKPDIALERAEKKRREKEARDAEALQRQAEENARIEKEKAEKAEKLAQELRERAHRESERKLMEQELAHQAREELDAEESQLRGALQQQQSKASRQARLVGESQERIRSKILAYLRLPHNLTGNPEVIFKVTLLPNGEVARAVLVRGSGQPVYDQEMERAILKASPLPLPNERDAAAVFRDGLILKFRPRDDAVGGR